MANKNRIRITYPSSEKIYIPGKIHKINVGMRKIKILDTVTRDENGELVHKKNNPVTTRLFGHILFIKWFAEESKEDT